MSTAPDSRTQDGQSQDRTARVELLLSRWQHRLSELGGRDTLLWYQDTPDTTLELTAAHPMGLARLLSTGSAPLPELIRQPGDLADATRRARSIGALATQLYDEHGVRTCYLASGTMRWSIPGSSRTPVAPVLLQPCRIQGPVGPAGRITLSVADDVRLNPVLVGRLHDTWGVDLDAAALEARATRGRGVDPRPVYDVLRNVCDALPDLRIDPRLIVGLFPTMKAPLVRDLTDQASALAGHDVIAAMAGDPDAMARVAAQPHGHEETPLRRERLAVDADRAQQEIVGAVRAGAHLVIEGPAGTGKTQTIANLVAALASDGRRTLVVSPRRTDIDQLADRLAAGGVGDLMLDLDADHARPGAVAGYLTDLLDRRLRHVTTSTPVPARLVAERDRLRGHAAAMHSVRAPWGVTLDEAQAAVIELEQRSPAPRSRVRLRGGVLAGMSAARRQELCDNLREVARMGAWPSAGSTDPWFGARVIGTEQLERARELVTRLGGGGLHEHRARLRELCEGVGLPEPGTMRQAEAHLQLMGQVHQTLESFQPELFDAPVADLASATADRTHRRQAQVQLGGVERRRLRKQAMSLVRPGTSPRDVHGLLTRAADQAARWRDAAGPGSRPSAPLQVRQLTQEHGGLRADLEWLGDRLAGTAEGGDLLTADLTGLEHRLAGLAAATDRLAKVPSVIGPLDALRANGLSELIDDVAARRLAPDDAVAELEFVWWTSVLEQAGKDDPTYGRHDGRALRQVARDYLRDDQAQIRDAALAVRDVTAARARRAAADLPDQVEALRDLAARRGDRSGPVELLAAAPDLVGTITPCWATGPLEVPRRVPPGMWFDVVIIDDAAALEPAEAGPAIARAGQVVAFGDSRQLPPAPLQLTHDQDPVPQADPPSLLDALAPLVPVRELATHYRSRDERIVAFLSAHLYDGQLLSLPGPLTDGVLRLDVVDGAGHGGESSDGEVTRVVQLMLDHLRRHPQESLGVVTLSDRHAQRIDDAFASALRRHRDLAPLAAPNLAEHLFVRPVHRVQGQVRDAVILTLGYGRGPGGEAPDRFGAISAAGGERRLATALSLARRRMVVVSSVSGGELDPTRLRSRGGAMLRDFLLYAASGGSARRIGAGAAADHPASPPVPGDNQAFTPAPVGPFGRRRRMASTGSVLERPLVQAPPADAATPLVRDLARRLGNEGLVVRTAYGWGSQRLDLVVEDPRRPGELLMAIETDGPGYGAIASARDADHLRVQQLERLGWVHERVWTTDVFREPAKEVARLVRAVHAASARQQARPRRG